VGRSRAPGRICGGSFVRRAAWCIPRRSALRDTLLPLCPRLAAGAAWACLGFRTPGLALFPAPSAPRALQTGDGPRAGQRWQERQRGSPGEAWLEAPACAAGGCCRCGRRRRPRQAGGGCRRHRGRAASQPVRISSPNAQGAAQQAARSRTSSLAHRGPGKPLAADSPTGIPQRPPQGHAAPRPQHRRRLPLCCSFHWWRWVGRRSPGASACLAVTVPGARRLAFPLPHSRAPWGHLGQQPCVSALPLPCLGSQQGLCCCWRLQPRLMVLTALPEAG